jgi:hypothetical protein
VPDQHPVAVVDRRQIGELERHQLGAAEGTGEAEGQQRTIPDVEQAAIAAGGEQAAEDVMGRRRLLDGLCLPKISSDLAQMHEWATLASR